MTARFHSKETGSLISVKNTHEIWWNKKIIVSLQRKFTFTQIIITKTNQIYV